MISKNNLHTIAGFKFTNSMFKTYHDVPVDNISTLKKSFYFFTKLLAAAWAAAAAMDAKSILPLVIRLVTICKHRQCCFNMHAFNLLLQNELLVLYLHHGCTIPGTDVFLIELGTAVLRTVGERLLNSRLSDVFLHILVPEIKRCS